MARSRRCLLISTLLAVIPGAAAAAAGAGESLPAHVVEDPGAPIVTEANVLASERFWPWQVALVRPWRPAGITAAIQPDHPGVLVRVETSRRARIDFGRDGVHEVPIAATDLIERANRVRLGELEKSAPNFVWAIGARLLDSGNPVLAGLSLQRVAGHRAFLCVFADPRADDFPALAAALAPQRKRDGVATILFPQGGPPDAQVFERLRSLGWTVPFVHRHLAEGYTRSLLPEGAQPPHVLLQTDEGRVLLQRGVGPELVAEIERAIDASFDAAAVASSAAAGARASSPH